MSSPQPRSGTAALSTPAPTGPTHYVGIGASAGGLEAIESFFKSMPSDSALAFIVIQHLSPDYKSLMVELLSKKTTMTVRRAEDGMVVEPNQVYLIPPKHNLTIFHGKLLLKEQLPTTGINLPIDIFLRSLAEDQGERAIAVILSGTGSDGTRGVRAIKEYNGMVMVQDEQSARFDGMPRAAIATGLADFVIPPEAMPQQLMAYVKHPYESLRDAAAHIHSDEDTMSRIFAELRDRTRVDFTFYKPSTIVRRIERRMVVCQVHDLDDYLRYLYNNPGEVMTLYREMLIGVTSFFRDTEAMQDLRDVHLPQLLLNTASRELRFWIAGCSTGEEAYTIAILAREIMERQGAARDLKIFATDLDRDAIMYASTGIYPESIAADLSPQLLSKYFYRKGDHYQIVRHVREMVVFAQHNLVKDPPFTNIDLVSCRNLLIYLQPVLQQKALQMFNFSLNHKGILFLGSSETVGDMVQYYSPLSQKYKIYQATGKHPIQSSAHPATTSESRRAALSDAPPHLLRHPTGVRDESRLIARLLELLVEHYVPLTVIVNEHLEIQYTLGNTEGFFKIPPGRIIYDISKMASRDISIPLTTGIQKVFRAGTPITYTNLRLKGSDQTRSVRMRIVPLPPAKGQDALVAVFLAIVKPDAAIELADSGESYNLDEDAQAHIRDLELELQFTRVNLQATIEELETSNEELQATNEELLASNEELQSTNEELQSTNEELYTVNAEYQNKINELSELNNDVDNLLTNSRIGKLLLDEDLQIRKFSPEITRIFLIMENDIGRPLTHLANRLVDYSPLDAIRRVQSSNQSYEAEVTTIDNTVYLMRILPYLIAPETYAGVVLTFVDITEVRRTEQSLIDSRQSSADIIQHMPAGLFVYELDANDTLRLKLNNPEALRLTGINSTEWVGRSFDELWPQAAQNGLSQKLVEVAKGGHRCTIDAFEYSDERLQGIYRIAAFKLPNRQLAVSFEDITAHVRLRSNLEESESRYRSLFETMAQGVVYQSASGEITTANPSAERILGLSLDQMRGRTSTDPRWKALREDGTDLPGEEHPSMVALRTGTEIHGFTMGVCNPSTNQTHWILVNATPQFRQGEDTPWQVFATFDDITQRVCFEQQLKQATQRLDIAFRKAGLAWVQWYPQTDRVLIAQTLIHRLGLTEQHAEMPLASWHELIHPEDRQQVEVCMQSLAQGAQSSYSLHYRLRHHQGHYLELCDNSELIADTNAPSPCVLATLQLTARSS